jgi:hypothetical protein
VAEGKEAEGEEAYVVVQGKETSIVDAECELRCSSRYLLLTLSDRIDQLRKILKGQM